MNQRSNSAAAEPSCPLSYLMAAAFASGLVWLYAVVGHVWLP